MAAIQLQPAPKTNSTYTRTVISIRVRTKQKYITTENENIRRSNGKSKQLEGDLHTLSARRQRHREPQGCKMERTQKGNGVHTEPIHSEILPIKTQTN